MKAIRKTMSGVRKLCLQSDWARSGMPLKESDFDPTSKCKICPQKEGREGWRGL